MIRMLCPFCDTYCDPVKPCPAQIDKPAPEVQSQPLERPGFFRGARISKPKQPSGVK